MRNYYRLLGISRDSSPVEIAHRINQFEQQDAEVAAKSREVLLPAHRRQSYDRAHRQYETLAGLWQILGEDNMDNTNRWQYRLAEFFPIKD